MASSTGPASAPVLHSTTTMPAPSRAASQSSGSRRVMIDSDRRAKICPRPQQHAERVVPAQLGRLVGGQAEPPALVRPGAQPAFHGAAVPAEQDPPDGQAACGQNSQDQKTGQEPHGAEFQRR